MSDDVSYPRLAYRMPGDARMSMMVEDEMFSIVDDAAGPWRPGDTKGARVDRAREALGRPKLWRVRSAMWRDGSGQWSAAAYTDFQRRYRELLERRRKQQQHEAQKADLIAGRRQPKTVELAFDEYRTLVARIEALETALRLRL